MARCAPPTKALRGPEEGACAERRNWARVRGWRARCQAAVRPAMAGRPGCAATWHRVARSATWCCERSRARADVVGACTRGVEVGCACACRASCSHAWCYVRGQ